MLKMIKKLPCIFLGWVCVSWFESATSRSGPRHLVAVSFFSSVATYRCGAKLRHAFSPRSNKIDALGASNSSSSAQCVKGERKRNQLRLVILLQRAELRADGLALFGEGLLEVLRGVARFLELHLGYLRDGVLQLRRDDAPRDFAIAGLGDRLHRAIIEVPDHLHHADRLRKRAH